MKEEIKNWWELALDDFDTAQKNLDIGKYHVAALFAQQAAEKALKALYIKTFNSLKKTHDLVYLARKLNLSQEIIDSCSQLSRIYVETRYPDVGGIIPAKKFSKPDAENFIKITSFIIQWLQKKL